MIILRGCAQSRPGFLFFFTARSTYIGRYVYDIRFVHVRTDYYYYIIIIVVGGGVILYLYVEIYKFIKYMPCVCMCVCEGA